MHRVCREQRGAGRLQAAALPPARVLYDGMPSGGMPGWLQSSSSAQSAACNGLAVHLLLLLRMHACMLQHSHSSLQALVAMLGSSVDGAGVTWMRPCWENVLYTYISPQLAEGLSCQWCVVYNEAVLALQGGMMGCLPTACVRAL